MAPGFTAVLRFVSIFQVAGASRRPSSMLGVFLRAAETPDHLF